MKNIDIEVEALMAKLMGEINSMLAMDMLLGSQLREMPREKWPEDFRGEPGELRIELADRMEALLREGLSFPKALDAVRNEGWVNRLNGEQA